MSPAYVYQLDRFRWCHLDFQKVALSALGSIAATGFSVNANSGIIGTFFPDQELPLGDDKTFHAYVGSLTGTAPFAWTFNPLPDAPQASAMSGRGLNYKGDVVGWFRNAAGEIHPYVWLNGAPAAMAFDIPGATFPKDSTIHNAVLDINDSGVVCGQYAIADDSGKPLGMGFVVDAYAAQAPAGFVQVNGSTLGGAKDVVLHGINNHGHVVGKYDHPAVTLSGAQPNTRSGLVSTDVVGGYKNCQPINVKDAISTVVRGINASGRIVGFFQDAAKQQHGFIWSVDASGVPIGSHVQVDFDDDPTTRTRLDHINDAGLMIGWAGPDNAFFPFVCWYSCVDFLESLLAIGHLASVQRVSASVAAGGRGWVLPFGGGPHPEPPPFPYPDPNQEAMMALALRALAGATGG